MKKKKKAARRAATKYSDGDWHKIIKEVETRDHGASIPGILGAYNIATSNYYTHKNRLYPNGYEEDKEEKEAETLTTIQTTTTATPNSVVFYGEGFKLIIDGTIPANIVADILSLTKWEAVQDES